MSSMPADREDPLEPHRLPEPLDRLAEALIEATAGVEKAGSPAPAAARERILAAIHSALHALPAAAPLLTATPPGRPADARAVWLHAMREPVNGIAGWAHVLGRTKAEGTWTRAAEAIERSAETLIRLVRPSPG
jgi:hypothetical protein